MPQQLTVFVREHCHLCVEMLRALSPYRQRYDLVIDTVDVDADPVLFARYSDRVPVLADGEVDICEFVLSDAALREHLGPPRGEFASVRDAPRNERIYAIVRQIPPGKVATYGQIAAIEGHATARLVGNAMAALPAGSDVPWQRVINSRGMLSPRGGGGGTDHQRQRLAEEGVFLDRAGRVKFERVAWEGPGERWLADNGCRQALPAGERQVRRSRKDAALASR